MRNLMLNEPHHPRECLRICEVKAGEPTPNGYEEWDWFIVDHGPKVYFSFCELHRKMPRSDKP